MDLIPLTSFAARPRVKDTRDFYLHEIQDHINRPLVLMQDIYDLPMKAQRNQKACGPHSAAWYKSYQEKIETGKVFDFSPRFGHTMVKHIDGRGANEGTDLRSLMKLLHSVGLCDEALLENDVDLTPEEYADFKLITEAMLLNAYPRIIGNYAFLKYLDFESLKQAIYQNGAVIVLLATGAPWWTSQDGSFSYDEKDILPLRTPDICLDDHFVVLHSYDEDWIYFANSNGILWGRNGHGYFGENYIPYIKEGAVSVDLDDDQLHYMKHKNIFEQIVILFEQFKNLIKQHG